MSPRIRWAHACNTMRELAEAFASGLDAIEADVSWNKIHQVAVMKHASSSDEQDLAKECIGVKWLEEALKADRRKIRILKLDFKALKAVPSMVEYLAKHVKDDSPEIWLNADILPGPGAKPDAKAPVDAHKFLKQCEKLPSATLSLGWTTAYSPFSSIRYEHKHVDDMLAMLAILSHAPHQKITFPIRASLAFESWPALARLLDHSPHTSLTLWTAHEGVQQHDLNWIVSVVEEHRVFVDCDKGPRHPHWHPARIAYYDWVSIARSLLK